MRCTIWWSFSKQVVVICSVDIDSCVAFSADLMGEKRACTREKRVHKRIKSIYYPITFK